MSVDPPTEAVYAASAAAWAQQRMTTDLSPAERIAEHPDRGTGPILDLGCGPGFHLAALPDPAVGLDPVAAMLALARPRAPHALLARGEAGALPFRRRSLGGAIVSKVYVHVERVDLPMALAELHRVLQVDAPAELVMFGGDQDLTELVSGDFPGRRFALWGQASLCRLFDGAGFAVEHLHETATPQWPRLSIGLRRLRSLPDTVGAGMRLLVCGLNPSLHAADMGVGFGRAGNRFWPAALAAGVVTVDRDPRHALYEHGVGMTDLAKRATRRADEIGREEFAAGLERVEHLCAWLRPSAVCMVGLAGWRAAVDTNAVPGWQSRRLGGSPVYVMPSTSGLNAHARLADLTDHLRRAMEPG